MLVRTKRTHFLSGSPHRLANSSAKMLFQGFHLLFTVPIGRGGPRKEIQLQEPGREVVVNTECHREEEPEREQAWWKAPHGLCQVVCFQFAQCHGELAGRCTPGVPILFDGVSLAFPFTL